MSKTLTDRESDIMRVLWDRGACRVSDVRHHLKDVLAHNTVLTMLGILEEKGFVRREAQGRGHVYFAIVPEKEARHSAVRHLVGKFFRGSSELLITHLVSDQHLSAAQIERLRTLLQDAGDEEQP
ncbi:MAG: BlaI/MecI/CopY family transcriptional regulator [Pseudomonadota bacterium]|jgi:predicted transcriptional regulator|nr:BlaI/MecI/CopY family transcriptional regulator [Pseudomonadota bacterium]